KRRVKEVQSEVNTSWGQLVFSTEGASLESIGFKSDIDGKTELLRTIFPVADTERESRCFLIGLQEKTPYFYDLIKREDTDNQTTLVYEANNDLGTLRKTFVVDQHKHVIDLIVEIDPKQEVSGIIEPRIFYPSPIVPNIINQDVISGIVIDKQESFEKIARSKIDVQRGWFEPSLFGTDDRYFVHTMINDQDNFVQRAYYKLSGLSTLFSILEGPEVTQKTNWKVSFYFGPKEVESLVAVDPRLEKTLGFYGFLAPVSKLLLKILKWLYGYLHNYGFAIIALTILIKLLLLPFTWRSERNMKQSAKQRAEFQKKLSYLQQRYKDDPDQLSRERAELIRKDGIPGLGAGCLPVLLIQMPIFLALNGILSSAIELYRAPMLWISDLSSPDPYFVLPILVGLAMLGQAMTVEASQRMTMIVMALVFGAVTAYLSAGLALYIVVSTALGVLQTMIINFFSRARSGNYVS
ncbi:MAG: YidC/Oxa1 family insertase periplasmic-domain containing protein, partial [bacterium]|nr:YidC/Oxa1 family insertase periplasmic-domain containing protein [bacterium]